MRPVHLPLFIVALLVGLSAPIGGATASEARVTGTATYLDHAMLPPGAVLEVMLQDVSRPGAPAEVIATDTHQPLVAPPYSFVLTYDPALIDDRHSYSVRARITLGDRLLMTTDTHAPVITRDAPMEVEVILRRVPARPERGAQIYTAPGLRLPASFTGTTPMASGPGMTWHLNLWPDQIYHLSQTYGGASDSSGDIGRWHADPERGAIVLRGGREAPVFLEILANGDLRLMGLDGTPIDSDLPYTLAVGPLEPGVAPLFLTGMVQRGAEGASFTECFTGRTYPIATQGDYPAAARALAGLFSYISHIGGDPDSPAFAVLEGRLLPSPGSEEPNSTHLVIDRFDRFELFLTCDRIRSQAGPPPPGPALTNTYWKITAVLGDEVAAIQTRREPHLILRTGPPPAFEATLGCTRIRGHHAAEGATLSFSEGATILLACPPELARQERRLAEALEQVARWHIDGPALELLNRAGDPVLTARAVYLR